MVVGEGDGYVDVPVTLSAPGQSVVTVDYPTTTSTAVSGRLRQPDYVTVSGTLTFAPGETTKTVRVEIDRRHQPRAASSRSSLDLGTPDQRDDRPRPYARVSIVDNDTVVATPQPLRPRRDRRRDGRHRERARHPGRPRRRGLEQHRDRRLHHQPTAPRPPAPTTPPTAGTLTFAPGETVKNVPVDITNDTAAEAAERFTVTLSNPTNATIADGTGTVIIGANDATAVAQPRISARPTWSSARATATSTCR